MNCKPGDMAVVVRADNPENLGLFVEVMSAWLSPGSYGGFRFPANEPAWVVKTCGRPFISLKWGKRIAMYERPVADAILRPIRPGDITDEEVRELFAPPVPNSTKETVE